MQRTEPMNAGEGIIGAVISAAVGWLAASVTKVSKTDFREMVKRIDAIEKDVSTRMPRTDFDKSFAEVKELVRDFRNEARAEFKELKNDLKMRT